MHFAAHREAGSLLCSFLSSWRRSLKFIRRISHERIQQLRALSPLLLSSCGLCLLCTVDSATRHFFGVGVLVDAIPLGAKERERNRETGRTSRQRETVRPLDKTNRQLPQRRAGVLPSEATCSKSQHVKWAPTSEVFIFFEAPSFATKTQREARDRHNWTLV